MAPLGRIAGALGTSAALAYVGAGFVLGPNSARAPPRGALQGRPALRGEADHLEVLREEPSLSEPAAEDPWTTAAKWLGAGLAAGMLLAASSGPVQALESPTVLAKAAPGAPPAGTTTKKRPTKLSELPKDNVGNPMPMGMPKQGWPVDYSGAKGRRPLELCKNNKKFKKNLKDELFKLSKQKGKYTKNTTSWNMWAGEEDAAKRRGKSYGGRMCGVNDGLPVILLTPDPAYPEGGWRGVLLPIIPLFLYIAGWIGYTGREYLMRTQDVNKEINIDVPLFTYCAMSSFAFPVKAWQDIVKGDFTIPQTETKQTGGKFWFKRR